MEGREGGDAGQAQGDRPLKSVATVQQMRPEIQLADLVRAVHNLRPDGEAIGYVARLLGFELVKGAEETPPLPPVSPEATQRARRRPPAQFKPKAGRPGPSGESAGDLRVEVSDDRSPVRVAVPGVPEAFDERPEQDAPLPPFRPLLTQRWTRAIVTKMLSAEVESGAADVPKLIEMIADNRPLSDIPRLREPTLSRGVQVLIDAGPGLAPYARDQERLLEQISDIVGRDRVEAWEFVGTPLRYTLPLEADDADGGGQVKGYKPPSAGTPVLLLTDLGIASPPFRGDVAAADEWLTFIGHVRRAGCPLLALVPYREERWPRHFDGLCRIVRWDQQTSVLTVLRAIS